MPALASNRQAYRDYEILEKYEAGIQLSGAEVKSLKDGQGQLKGSFVRIMPKNEAYLFGCFIAPYKRARQIDYDPSRPRKLLLNKSEIEYFKVSAKGKNLTIIPIKLYTIRRGLIKLEIGLAKGKKKHEKKKTLQEREFKREIQRTLKKYG